MSTYGIGASTLTPTGQFHQDYGESSKLNGQQALQSLTFQAFAATVQEIQRLQAGIDQLHKRLDVVMTPPLPQDSPIPQPPPSNCQLSQLGVEMFTQILNARISVESLLARLAI